MIIKGSVYNVEFKIDKLSMARQNQLYELVKNFLTRDERDSFHITVIDYLGGRHQIWDNIGCDPNGIFCQNCVRIDCDGCNLFAKREALKQNGEN